MAPEMLDHSKQCPTCTSLQTHATSGGKPTAVSQDDQTSAGAVRRRRPSHHLRRWVRLLLTPKVIQTSPSQDATALAAERMARRRILIRREEQLTLTPSKTALRRILRDSGPDGARPEERRMSDEWNAIYGRSVNHRIGKRGKD